MTYAYNHGRKLRRRQSMNQLRRNQALLIGRDNQFVALFSRGFFGRLKWAFLKR